MNTLLSSNTPLRTVLLADDHMLMREALKMLVSSIFGEVRFVEVVDGDGLLDAMHSHPGASLALVDLKIPAMQGGYRLLELALRYPRIPLVVVSALSSPNVARRILSIPSVFAVVPKSSTTDCVRAAIASAMVGRKVPLTPPGLNNAVQPAMLLTPRQRQICSLLRQGMSNKLIAAALGIGEGTVKNHLSDIFRVLNATNRTQAAQVHIEAE